jgi:L-iditol 2-dehydrogenase
MATKVLGSYAEYLLIPERIARLNVFAKPDHLSFDQASLLEPLACVAHGTQQLNLRPSDRALVIGPGAIGLMFAAALMAEGVDDVTVAGRSHSRLGAAEGLGAKVKLLGEVEGRWDLVIECTGKVEVWEKSLDFTERGATLMLFGGPPAGTRASFDTKKLHYDDIRLLSPFHFGTRAVRQSFDWLAGSAFDLSPLISGVRRLEEGAEVFADLERGAGIKFVFHPAEEA